jgi:hypothetical protein
MLHVRIDVPTTIPALEALTEGLVALNIELMQHASERGVELPFLYDSGVVYRAEPSGREWWESARDLLSVASQKTGDCEDVACYMVSWLRFYENEPARVHVIRNRRGNFHCLVQHADGSLEDPSAILLEMESDATGVPMRDLATRTTR